MPKVSFWAVILWVISAYLNGHSDGESHKTSGAVYLLILLGIFIFAAVIHKVMA